MKDGFITVAAVTPHLRVADVGYNTEQTLASIREAYQVGAQFIILPELGLTGYTCADLFWQETLLDAAQQALRDLIDKTSDLETCICVGLPVVVQQKLYNCAAVFSAGRLLGLVPKQAVPNYNEFYEARHFTAGPQEVSSIAFAGAQQVPFGTRQLFSVVSNPDVCLAVELCEDLWIAQPPSTQAALAGATLIANLSASPEVVGKSAYRRLLVTSQSARLAAGYVYASAGWEESTTDLVFGGHNLICENGALLAQTQPFGAHIAIAQIDIERLVADRRRVSTFTTQVDPRSQGFVTTTFDLALADVTLTRYVDPHPFVPSSGEKRQQRCEEIFEIQAHGLAKRLMHTGSQRVVVGLSGGLDSTLALLVCARAFDLLDLDHEGILAVTMPGFGTTERTHTNACELSQAIGSSLLEVSIVDAVRQHFADIGHDENIHDVTYENAQARERTQVLMDIANRESALVVGTGDLSELALGWATYNGDHMSMYAPNASVPKTLVRHLVDYVADVCESEELSAVLLDIVATPVSPELLPASADGSIAQKTEEVVGPYELHDFFLYYVLRYGFIPAKIYRLACHAFCSSSGVSRAGSSACVAARGAVVAKGQASTHTAYDKTTILHWLRVFYKRFFQQQFKRSCLPDGPKVGSVAVSPRGDLRIPSDAVAELWLKQLDELGAE